MSLHSKEEVPLSGFVDNDQQKNQAYQLAKNVRGVKKVESLMTINALPLELENSYRQRVTLK